MAAPNHQDQPRDPAGRWSRAARGRSPLEISAPEGGGADYIEMSTVLGDDEYNATGSYSHPPIPRNPEQVIKFWLTTPIPDRILDQVDEAFTQRNFERSRAGDAAKLPGSVRGLRASTREASEKANADAVALAGRQKLTIPAYLLADVVRLAGMYRQGRSMSAAKKAELLGTQFVLNARTDKMSPAEAWERYELEGIAGSLKDTHEKDREARAEFLAWNLFAGVNRAANYLSPPGAERAPEYLKYGEWTQ